jgi:hypothetical protein
MMFDFVGTRIDEGDKAVYCRTIGSHVVMEDVKVHGFTDTMVKIDPLSVRDTRKGYTLCNPDKLVVYEKVRI